jgi:hypothetical protein
MVELSLVGFLSYARTDDDHNGGHLTDFRRMLEGELRAQTGEQVTIFQDREDILWGQVWKDRLNIGVDSATVLVPIITPSYFASSACRKELTRFLDREKKLGRRDLIFPLYFIATPLIDDPESRKADDLAAKIADRQCASWIENRFEPVDSLPIRKQIAALAAQIVAAFERGTVLNPAVEVVQDDPWADDEEDLGLVERINRVEVAMPALVESMNAIRQAIELVGEITQDATVDIEKANKPGSAPGAKLAAIHRYREKLEPEIRALEEITKEYADLIGQADIGMCVLIPAAAESSPEDRATSEKFLTDILGMREGVDSGLTSIEEFAATVEAQLQLSSTTRPMFRALLVALRRVTGSRATFDNWVTQSEIALSALREQDD